MKKINRLIIPVVASVLVLGSCKKGFEEMNQNPYAINQLDPAFLFTNAERQISIGGWENEQTIVQQTVNAYDLGATAGYQFLVDFDLFNRSRFTENYGNVIKPLVQIMALTKDNASQKNLYNMARIWRAYTSMILVDTYGDVPYSEAGKAFLENINFPKYDKSSAIYDDIYSELKTATAALAADGGYVKADLFFGPTGNAANQVAQWKKVGYSLMLRLGMRYSSLNPTKAAAIVQEAVAGGVMQTNSDDVKITQYNTNFNNPQNVSIRTINPYYYYIAEPFANFLRTAKDPRLKYIAASYANPININTVPDTTTANQFGFPIGYSAANANEYPGYRGTKGGGQNYSQLNYNSTASATAPTLLITNAQTKLLLAEARLRNYLTTGSTAKEYYEAGVIAALDQYELYPGKMSPAVTAAEKTTYLANANVAWNPAKGLELINTQYWITSYGNGAEAYANFRRTDLPKLNPVVYKGFKLPGDGFVRRIPYPNDELSLNPVNYNAAVASMGGDDFTQRIFWDVTAKVPAP